jgi:hypothetical protein
MLYRPVVHEFDNNSLFLRGKELELHQKKLNEIKNRKNKFSMSLTSDSDTFNFRKKSPTQMNVVKSYLVEKDNKYLYEKLFKISSRDNKLLNGSISGRCTSISDTRVKATSIVRHIQEKKIMEENLDMLKRISER